MEQAGFEDAEAVPRLLAIWEKYVSEKPRPGYRPLGLSYSAQGTYNGEEFLDAEQITKNKLYIYTREKNTGFDRRFLMVRNGLGGHSPRMGFPASRPFIRRRKGGGTVSYTHLDVYKRQVLSQAPGRE